jgi:hypothetical protein
MQWASRSAFDDGGYGRLTEDMFMPKNVVQEIQLAQRAMEKPQV